MLNRTMVRHGIAGPVQAAQACSAWQEAALPVLGADFASRTMAISFKDGTLKLKVAGASHAQHVKLHEVALLDNMNSRLSDKTKVERIRIIPG